MNRNACHRRGVRAAMQVVGRRTRPYAGAALIAFGLSGGFDALAADLGQELADAGLIDDMGVNGSRPDLGDGGTSYDLATTRRDLSYGYPSYPSYPSYPGGSYNDSSSSDKGCAWGPPAPLPYQVNA